MKNQLMKLAVRTITLITSRKRAAAQARQVLARYTQYASGITAEQGSRIIEAPIMLGVDRHMKRWSYYMLLEHNMIVSRSVSALVQQLVTGEEVHGEADINIKTDVLPSDSAGPEQVELLSNVVNNHIEMTQKLGSLRGSKTFLHPLFGQFDAHRWNCMLSLHLKLHLKQAAFIIKALNQAN